MGDLLQLVGACFLLGFAAMAGGMLGRALVRSVFEFLWPERYGWRRRGFTPEQLAELRRTMNATLGASLGRGPVR